MKVRLRLQDGSDVQGAIVPRIGPKALREAAAWRAELLGMDEAERESRRPGWEGRVALHSKPEAFGFYLKQGFVDLGPDEGFHIYGEIR